MHPIDAASKVAVQAVIDTLPQARHVERVVFACFGKDTLEALVAALNAVSAKLG